MGEGGSNRRERHIHTGETAPPPMPLARKEISGGEEADRRKIHYCEEGHKTHTHTHRKSHEKHAVVVVVHRQRGYGREEEEEGGGHSDAENMHASKSEEIPGKRRLAQVREIEVVEVKRDEDRQRVAGSTQLLGIDPEQRCARQRPL